MGKIKKTSMNKELFDKCASAHEYTGLFQRIHLDPDEIKTFHKMYNELDDDE